jgi:hypothetical protein
MSVSCEFHDSEIHRYEAEDEAENGETTNYGPPMDLLSSILALSAVQEHLRERGTVSIALERLKLALISTLHGTPPAMLIGQDSVAVVLRDAMGPDYGPVLKNVINSYILVDQTSPNRSLRWLDEIPAMAAEWRAAQAAKMVEV